MFLADNSKVMDRVIFCVYIPWPKDHVTKFGADLARYKLGAHPSIKL